MALSLCKNCRTPIGYGLSELFSEKIPPIAKSAGPGHDQCLECYNTTKRLSHGEKPIADETKEMKA